MPFFGRFTRHPDARLVRMFRAPWRPAERSPRQGRPPACTRFRNKKRAGICGWPRARPRATAFTRHGRLRERRVGLRRGIQQVAERSDVSRRSGRERDLMAKSPLPNMRRILVERGPTLPAHHAWRRAAAGRTGFRVAGAGPGPAGCHRTDQALTRLERSIRRRRASASCDCARMWQTAQGRDGKR